MMKYSHILDFNKLYYKIILFTFLGIFIPHLTGLLCRELTPIKYLLISYLYYSFIAILIWKGNALISSKILKQFSWTLSPYKRLFFFLILYVIFTSSVALMAVLIWYHWIVRIDISWDYARNFILISTIVVLFISHIYETVQLIRKAISDNLRNENLEHAKSKAELATLKSQIDPHFLFNSLNTLSFLIETDQKKANDFNDNLATVYRYILFNKDRDVVLLEEELEFALNYFYLQNIRFSDAILINISIPKNELARYLIPPISLQILLENAIKHNEFSIEKPLNIRVYLDNDQLYIENNNSKRKPNVKSSGIGLINLNERYKLIFGKEITYGNYNNMFKVMLPLILIER